MQTVEPAQAVNDYLTFLRDPDSLRDETAIRSAQRDFELETDPLQKMVLFSHLLRLEELPADRFLDNFIDHAKTVADSEGLSASSFEALGVKPSVLRKAGLM